MASRDLMFDRYIGIDWSGAATDADRTSDIAVASWRPNNERPEIVLPPPVNGQPRVRWSRQSVELWLADLFRQDEECLVAADFGFGLPWNSDNAIFGVAEWRPLLNCFKQGLHEHRTARAFAESINQGFNNAGPFQFDGEQLISNFYLRHGVSYYRLTDLCAPQAKSHWSLIPGRNGSIGFSTITGLAMIGRLLTLRDNQPPLDFCVWPQESIQQNQRHVLAETYPAILPHSELQGRNEHERDALRIADFLRHAHDQEGRVDALFSPPRPPFGRFDGVNVEKQVEFEGWILGLV